MNEQQRREQIMRARQQQMQQRATVPAMSDADAARIAAESGAITQEQVVMAAMLGKMINGGLNDIKKQAVGEGLKVGNVDMSKVMPSGIAKAIGMRPAPAPMQPQMPLTSPVQTQPLTEPIQVPALFPPVPINNPVVQHENTGPLIQSLSDPNQLELEFDKKARYDDIYQKLQVIEEKMIALNEKANTILELLNKKKIEKDSERRWNSNWLKKILRITS